MAYAKAVRPTRATTAGAFAALAAGPAFLVGIALASWVEYSAKGITLPTDAWGGTLFFLMIGTLIGALIAFIPCILASLALATIARRPGIARLPEVWMLTGGLSAGLIGLLLDSNAPILFGFATAGVVCAAAARYKLRDLFAEADRGSVQFA